MYLCKQGFSTILVLENKPKYRLKESNDLRVTLNFNISSTIFRA